MKQAIYLLIMMLVFSISSYGQFPNQLKKKSKRSIRPQSISTGHELNNSPLKAAVIGMPKLEEYIGYTLTNGLYVESDKNLFQYNVNNQIEFEIYSEKSEGVYTDYFKEEYGYNEIGKVSSITSYYMLNDIWTKEYMITYEYDALGLVFQEIEQYWVNGNWELDCKFENTYDANGKILSWIRYSWREGSWSKEYMLDYEYNEAGLLIRNESFEWNDIDWVSDGQYILTIGEDGFPLEFITFDKKDSDWAYFEKFEYTFDEAGNLLTEVYFTYDLEIADWVGVEKYEYTYDIDFLYNNLIIPDSKHLFPELIFEPVSMPLTYTLKPWDDANDSSGQNGRREYIYSGISTNILTEYLETKVYPSVVTSDVTIESSGNFPVSIFKLYDISGNCVLETTVQDKKVLSLNNLGKGIYLYSIIAGNEKKSGRLIKK